MKILWVTYIPSPYRVDFFNELGKYSELFVLFETRNEVGRDSSWLDFAAENFKCAFVSEGTKLKDFNMADFDHIFVTNYYDAFGIKTIAQLKLREIPYILEGDGAFAGAGHGIREIIKRWILKDARLCFSTGAAHDRYYEAYKVSADRIVRYPFSSIREKDILSEPVREEEKNKIRNKLGMSEQYILLAVGQFIPRKGYDILIKSIARLKDINVGCYIVGGQPPEEYTELTDEYKVKDRVHFIDFKIKPELDEYYMAADLFVHPTREDIWGLVINEAMAKGIPVVTTDRCIAGTELIKTPEAGEIVITDNPEALANAIAGNLESKTGRSARVLETIRPYTIENMAKRHVEILTELQCTTSLTSPLAH